MSIGTTETLTNAHGDADLGGAPARLPPPLQLPAMKALNDDIQMRSDWFLPLCTGAERCCATSTA